MRTILATALVGLLLLTGCAATREMSLKARADAVESSLRKEQQRVLALPATDATRSARLDHLTNLRQTLSSVNVARGAVRDGVPSQFKGIAYDAIEEAYSTIEWNIPLGPGDAKRTMPSQWTGSTMNFGALGAP